MITLGFSGSEKRWDVCVVGSGPVGLSVAMESAAQGLSVAVVEAGDVTVPSIGKMEDARALIVDSRRHAPMELAVSRTLGGTSATWGGRCLPFDDIDFVSYEGMPERTWPVSKSEIGRWYGKACTYLGCGRDVFEVEPALPNYDDDRVLTSRIERWSVNPRLGKVFRSKLEASSLVHVFLRTSVVGLEFRSNDIVDGVLVVSAGCSHILKAKQIVLALGGV